MLEYDFNIYCDGDSIGLYAYRLEWNIDWGMYQMNPESWEHINFDMHDPANNAIIAHLLQDYIWTDQNWEDYDTWTDLEDVRLNAPKVLAEFLDNLPEYDVRRV